MSRQRGQAILATVLLVGLGVTLLTYGVVTEVTRVVEADTATRAVLEEAREALIGRAAADLDRPGSLPCPDVDNDGLAENTVGGNCPGYIGRLPFRSLGVPDLRDSAGERLWYAVSPRFRDDVTAQPINSDTFGSITAYANGTASTLTSTYSAGNTNGAAVILAPGGALGAQVRDSTVAPCAVTGTSIARNLCADNYLESASGVSNASATGPYIAAPSAAQFNDKLAVLRTGDIMAIVEQRVGAELREALRAYRKANLFYPWPDTDGDRNSNVGSPGTPSVNRGRVPDSTSSPATWIASLTAAVPYFVANRWAKVIYYAVGRTWLEGADATTCPTCNARITVDGNNLYELLLLTSGSAAGNRVTMPADYIDDPANRDANDTFVSPTRKGIDGDRLYSVTAVMPPANCAANAQTLLSNAPCGWKGVVTSAACAAAAVDLAGCTCAASAQVMVTPPCVNTLKPPACQAAVATLKLCNS